MMACRPAFSSLTRTQGVLQAAAFGNCCSKTTHAGATGPVWCFAGVVFLPWPKNLTQGHTEPSFFFCSKNEFTPPPKGGGAGVLSCSAHFLVMRSPMLFRGKSIRLLSAGAFGNCCSQPARTPPTGPVWGIAGVRFPTQLSKPHTGPHGAEFGFTPFSGALLLL